MTDINLTFERILSLFPEHQDTLTEIFNERKKIETFDVIIGVKDGVGDIHFTNDPEKMLLCGARISSSYSPWSESFEYLPSMVLQPYIGMIYITSGSRYKLPTDAGDIIAPDYLVRAFVMYEIHDGKPEVTYIMPTYTDNDRLYSAFNDVESREFVVAYSNTPPIDIHLDCVRMFKTQDGHAAICGASITPLESHKMYQRYYRKGGK